MIIEQARRQKMPIPDKIKNKPLLLTGLQFFYNAFWELTTCRALGMAEGPIPWTAIYQYAAAHGIRDSDEIDYLSAVVKRMDIAYLDYRHKKGKTGTNEKKITPKVPMQVTATRKPVTAASLRAHPPQLRKRR
jgi:hypothetical protein